MINDVTTTLDNPPVFEVLLGKSENRQAGFKSEASDVHARKYPNLKPLSTSLDASELYKLAIEVAKSEFSWEIAMKDPERTRFEAVATTFLLRFKDDVVVEVRKQDAEGSGLHIRSRSRLGRSDLGANKKRIDQFLKSVEVRLAS